MNELSCGTGSYAGDDLLFNEMERRVPGGLVEDVDEDVPHEGDALSYALLVDLIRGRLERPVDEHGAADDVLAGNEAPVTAVEALRAVVAHGKDLAGGDDQILALDVARQLVLPACGHAVIGAGRDAGEVVAIGAVGMLWVVVVDGLAGLRLVLGNAVQVDDSVPQVDTVARDCDGALHQEEVRLTGLEEDDDISAADIPVVGEGSPLRRWGQGDAIHQNVVADEQRLDHRGGGNLEVLEDERHHKQADGQHAADGGKRLQWSLGLL